MDGQSLQYGPESFGVGGNELTIVPHYSTGQPNETYSDPCPPNWPGCSPGAPLPFGTKIFNLTYTWVDAEVFQFRDGGTPGGDLGIMVGGLNKSTSRSDLSTGVADMCDNFFPAGLDAMYSARRFSNGAWVAPAYRQCPVIHGQTRTCNRTGEPPYLLSQGNIDPTGGRSIVRIPNGTGYRYFMAFNGGNADYIHGAVYWAVSETAEPGSWTIYNWTPPTGYDWTPVIRAEYHHCDRGGVIEPWLTFDANDTQGGLNPNGTFYLYFTYIHAIGHVVPEVFVYRFGYNPLHTFGFGGNNQLYYDSPSRGARGFFPHTGRLVFSTTGVPGEGDVGPPVGSDEKIRFSWNGTEGMTSISASAVMGGNPGDMKKNVTTGEWVKVTVEGGIYKVQRNMSLSTNTWSTPQTLDASSIHNIYPTTCSGVPITYAPGIWYGSLGGRTGWWMWATVHAARDATTNALIVNPPCFSGQGIVVATLCDPNDSPQHTLCTSY